MVPTELLLSASILSCILVSAIKEDCSLRIKEFLDSVGTNVSLVRILIK